MKRKSLLFLLLFALIAPWTAMGQAILTVHDGTTGNSNVPIHGLWADAYLKCEMVYPASELEEMMGGTINSIKYYASSPASAAWTGTWQVSLMEVDYTTISAFAGPGTVVYEGLLDGTQSEMEITFTTPYTYTGGNLLVCVYQPTKGNYKGITWTGETVTGASVQGYNSSSLDGVSPTQRNFLPKTTFTYTPGASDCDMPTAIAVSDITADGATVTWEGDGNAWNLRYKASTDADFTLVENLTTTTYTLTGLNGNTNYSVGVQTVCTGSTSFFKSTSFTTDNPCLAPTNLQTADITDASATLSWTAGYPTQSSWIVSYKKSADAWTDAETETVTSPTVTLTDLAENTTYNVRIYACADGAYLSGSFTTKYACAAPTSLQITDITTSSATLSWTPGYQETEWTVRYKKNADGWDNAETVTATSPTITLNGLDEDTQYNVRVFNCTGENDPYLSGSFYTAEACPDGLVCIGSGKTTNSYLPTYTYYNYSLTQQIYTAAEIGGAGAIMSIDFYSTATERTRTLDIYMVMTEKASFASTTDYIAATASDLVYSGSVTFLQNAWTTIALDNPFAYADDTKNVALIVHDKTGGYVGSPAFWTFDAPDMSLYNYNDNYDYVPSTPGTYSDGTYTFYKGAVKNRVRLQMGEITDCDMPTNLAVSNITMGTADLTWTAGGSETAWQVCINGDEDNLIDVTNNAYQMTNLTAATTYTVKVRANCGSSQSYWTPEISFNTAICDVANQCQISYEFSVNSESYTTWHAATIDIVDVETNVVIATLTYDAAAPTGTVNVCDGRAIKFVYNPATPDFYNQYNAYSFADVNNEVIFSGSGTFETVNYNVDCTIRNCEKPTGLAVASMVATWEAGEATAWNLQYKKTSDTEWTAVNGLDAATYTFTGLDYATDYEVQVQADCGTDGTSSWTTSVTFSTPICAPEDMCSISIELTDSYGDGWNGNAIQVVDTRSEAVLATWTLSSGSSATETLAVCDGREIKFVWVAGSYGYEASWVINDANGNEITSGDGTDLADGTALETYLVICPDCVMPTAVEVEAAAESATVTITGNAASYNIRYRTKRGFNYGFEQAEAWTITDFDPCTVYDGDGGQCYNFEGGNPTNIPFVGSTIAFQNGFSSNLTSHSGNAFGMMLSSIPSTLPDGVTANDDWFILPALEIEDGYIFSFYGREITTSYGDEVINVGIYGETDGTFAEVIAENVAISSTTYQLYSYDLSAYAGQTIKLAINYVSEDIFGFMFDDIFVGDPTDDTWDYVVEEVTSPYELTHLGDNTDYELQVQSVCGVETVSEWTNTVAFTTLPLCEAPTNVAVSEITSNSAVVTWESEATSFDIEVNGEDLIEDVTSPYTLSNLDPATSYIVKVRTNCGDTGYSAWVTVSFTTECNAFDLPYEYGFNDVVNEVSELDCWGTHSLNNENSFGLVWRDQATGDVALRFSSYNEIEDEETESYMQVLVSPQLNTEAAINVQFEYETAYFEATEDYDEYTSTEYFTIGYSSTTNDLSAFTWDENYVEATTADWMTFNRTVPAGTKYVAVLYLSEYSYYLYVDNFSFTESAGGQTIELTEGWNDISIYLEVGDEDGQIAMLQALEEALGENALMITGDDGFTMYDDEEWFGELDQVGLTNEQSYSILVVNDCTVELQGTPADPADHAITINPGWNNIGFPYSEPVEIEVALGEFEPEDEDMLTGPEAYSMYDVDEWFGELTTLVPGQGYQYLSKSDQVKHLVFQTAAVTRRAIPNLGSSKKQSIKGNMEGRCKSINGDNRQTKRVK